MRVMGRVRRAFRCVLLLAVVFCLASPAENLAAQEAAPPLVGEGSEATSTELDDLMVRMSTADKVGQLMLVSFRGSGAEAGSDVARLVQELRVGGVILHRRTKT